MITFEKFIQSFIGCDIPDDAVIEKVTIDDSHKCIKVLGVDYDPLRFVPIATEYIVAYYEEDEDDNNATQEIVKG